MLQAHSFESVKIDMNPKPRTKQKKQQAKTSYLVRLPRLTLVAKGALGLAGQTDRWSQVKII